MTQYQETMCEKDVIWAKTLIHLRDFIVKAFRGEYNSGKYRYKIR